MLRRIRTAVLILPLLLAVSASAGTVSVKGIRHWSNEGYTRVVIDLDGPTEFKYARLSNPDRIYVDILGSEVGDGESGSVEAKDGLLKTIRAGQFNPETVRVVLDLTDIKDYKVFSLDEPYRVVVDVFGEDIGHFIPRIVIDAGHGGKDPGAIGPSKLKEKDVALDIAERLKKILEKDGAYKVFLTRDIDEYLDLEERTMVANEKKADLFVSIHANAHARRNIKGVETYLLNWTDEEEAMKVAARENNISLKRMHTQRSEQEVIFASLALQNKRDESLPLAHYVQGSIVDTVGRGWKGVDDLGVKQAYFYVLIGARMPSVLVEVGFITNRTEEKRLKSKTYRDSLAKGIAGGIVKYIKSTKPVQEIVRR